MRTIGVLTSQREGAKILSAFNFKLSTLSLARRPTMNDKWTIRGVQFVNCNCAWGCPCQFGAKSTNGFCEGFGVGHIEEGYFNDTKLDGLNWVAIGKFPGEIAEGNGHLQAIIDERADGAQREAMGKILRGESTAPGATHFYIFNSMASEVLDPLYAPIEVSIDVDARQANVRAPVLSKPKEHRSSMPSRRSRCAPGSICRTGSNTPSRKWARALPRSLRASLSNSMKATGNLALFT